MAREQVVGKKTVAQAKQTVKTAPKVAAKASTNIAREVQRTVVPQTATALTDLERRIKEMEDANRNVQETDTTAVNAFTPAAPAFAEDRTIQRTAARDQLRMWLSTFFGEDTPEGRAALSFIDDQVRQDATVEGTMLNLRQQKFYQDRFAGNAARRKAGLQEFTESEYLQSEETYDKILRAYGLEDLATRDTFTAAISNIIDPDEFANRVGTVYDPIVNADEPLKRELNALKTSFGLTDQDFAKALLLGKEGANSLQTKIRQAEIRSEASVRGLTTQLGDVELQRRGLTRAQAAAGFEQVAQQLQPLQRISEIYKQQMPAGELQRQLESETLLGQQSERKRRLVEQEAAAFSGSAGTTPTLASRARAGQF